MVAVSAPDPRVLPLLAPGQVPATRTLVTFLSRAGVSVPLRVVPGGHRKSSRDSVHTHEVQVSVLPPEDQPRLDLGEPGSAIVARSGIRVGRSWVWAPQGVGRVQPNPTRDRSGAWALTARSWESVIADCDLLVDVTVRGSALDVLARLIGAACPGVSMVADVEDVQLPATRLECGQAGSRWAAVEQVSTACGWVVRCDLSGAFRVRARSLASTVTAPDWAALRTASDDGARGSREPGANVVVVRDGSRKWWGIALDDRPGSPTYVGADVVAAASLARTRGLNAVPRTAGLVCRVEDVDGIGSDAQAAQAAQGLLAGGLVGPRSLSVAVSWQPWADVDDRPLITGRGDDPVLGLVTSVDVPLDGGEMRMEVSA